MKATTRVHAALEVSVQVSSNSGEAKKLGLKMQKLSS